MWTGFLILVTRRRVSSATLKMWRPSIAFQKPLSNQGSDIEDESQDNVEDKTPSPILDPAPFPLSQRRLRRRDRSEEEVEQDIVSISSDSGKQLIHI